MKLDGLSVILIIINLLFIVATISLLVSKGADCVSNPFIYGANNDAKQFKGLVCSCHSPMGSFSFDNETVTFTQPLNFSNFTV